MTKGPCANLQVKNGRDPVAILGAVFDALLSTLLVGASAAGLVTALIGSNFTPSPSYEVRWAASLPHPGKALDHMFVFCRWWLRLKGFVCVPLCDSGARRPDIGPCSVLHARQAGAGDVRGQLSGDLSCPTSVPCVCAWCRVRWHPSADGCIIVC